MRQTLFSSILTGSTIVLALNFSASDSVLAQTVQPALPAMPYQLASSQTPQPMMMPQRPVIYRGQPRPYMAMPRSFQRPIPRKAVKARSQKTTKSRYATSGSKAKGTSGATRMMAYREPNVNTMFQRWVDWEPQYRLVPGDQLDIVVSSAPELSRTLTVGPDGRVVMPMVTPIMAAGRTFNDVQTLLQAELAKQLRDPTLAVTPRAYSPEQIYVGGAVGQPGTYTLPGQIGTFEAILMAGGTRTTAKSSQVAVLRRAPNGGMMMRSVDIKAGLGNIHQFNDNLKLRRGDIIYVPKTTLAEIGTFMQNFRQTYPVDIGISYDLGNNANSSANF